MKLDKVNQNVQLICEAIASVMDIDVTIVDESLVRIAGTGRYLETIGQPVSERSAFSYALKTGSEFIIDNPGDHQACKMCDCKNKCNEHAEVCCPIKKDDEIIGVIGLIAFESHQKSHIIENQGNLLQFLNRMADLISSKVNEQEALDQMALLAKELEVVVDSIDTAFIALLNDGSIMRANKKAKKMMQKSNLKHINELFDELEIAQILNMSHNANNKPYTFKLGEVHFQGFYDVALIKIGQEVKGYVLSIRAIEDVLNTVNEILFDAVTTSFEHIMGNSESLVQAKDLANRVAKSTSTVLILGESGTGKELFSRAIHQASNRRDAPFVAINCAAIPEQLLESELFGYEEGAFTGAKKGGKPGKFQLANKGTLFLDEIGDMPLHLQSKLLRVLQDQKVERIGGHSPIDIDVRIVAATNQDLETKVDEGAFRKDLYYRLNVIPITVPALRQRKDDIPLLVWYMVRKASKKLSKAIGSIEDDCFELLKAYEWPGNVRELENTIEYAVNMCDDHTLRIQSLPKKFQKMSFSNALKQSDQEAEQVLMMPGVNQEQVPLSGMPLQSGMSLLSSMPLSSGMPLKSEDGVKKELIMPLMTLEKEAIKAALEFYKPQKRSADLAAKALGISRATLYRKISEYEL